MKDDSTEDGICGRRIGFMVNGVGDHYSGMGDGLLAANPTYAKASRSSVAMRLRTARAWKRSRAALLSICG